MLAFYISFGQAHVHRVNGKTFDCDSLCRIYAHNEAAARQRAKEAFDMKWSFLYTEPELSYFPRGIIDLER